MVQERKRYLQTAEVKRLINACDADLRNMVIVMAVTGCRYRELERLEVGDVNPDSGGLLLIRFSKTNKPRHIALTTQLCAGRSATEVMLQRSDGRLWNGREHDTAHDPICGELHNAESN